MTSKIIREEKGQANMTQVVIATTALIFIGILTINGIYEGSVVQFIDNENLGNMTGNRTDFTTSNTPISEHTTHNVSCANQTDTFNEGADANCGAPCYVISSYTAGNITVNATEATGNPNEEVITCDYYFSRLPGSGAASSPIGTGVTTSGYLWTGLSFLGLGLLVLGAVFVLRIVRRMGG